VIRTFEPVAGTVTHVLLDTWYSAKGIWRAARERGFLITSGLKSNRWLRVEDPTAPNGWGGPRLSDYTAHLSASDYVQFKWPKGEEDVYVHVVTTQVRKLYRCQVVIVRQSLDAPLSQARYWASSDLEASPQVLLAHIATRWDIEVLFGDGKEELGLDQYQLMSATAVVRFWTLAMLAYIFLEEERDRLQTQWQRPVTIGEARREIQRRHRRHLLNWLHEQFQSGVEPDCRVGGQCVAVLHPLTCQIPFLVVSSDSTFPTAPPRTVLAPFSAHGSPVPQCLFMSSHSLCSVTCLTYMKPLSVSWRRMGRPYVMSS
jgi:hypothetical protein